MRIPISSAHHYPHSVLKDPVFASTRAVLSQRLHELRALSRSISAATSSTLSTGNSDEAAASAAGLGLSLGLGLEPSASFEAALERGRSLGLGLGLSLGLNLGLPPLGPASSSASTSRGDASPERPMPASSLRLDGAGQAGLAVTPLATGPRAPTPAALMKAGILGTDNPQVRPLSPFLAQPQPDSDPVLSVVFFATVRLV
ncbi:unnamed protein product [Protopolystoma xenopodis]|uniref:Uncharacterized protein n=1 Tax=Protopolystoma xenopodis TaxID=117903 RepID=A0A448XAD2_9PLAT|nr:unnamed protein product [Protopolystoma xenopodis]